MMINHMPHPDTAHNVLKAIRLAELNGKDEFI